MGTAGWEAELCKPEYKNWVKVGCGLKIAKKGISQLIQQKFEAWYRSLISRPPLQSLARCSCVDGAETWCRTCVNWEAQLRLHHRSRSEPRMCWDNSDRTQWGSPTGAWEVAKVFMPTLGSRKTHVIDAETTDIGDLLNLLEWCTFVNRPVRRWVLISVREQCRNQWAHAPKQELQDTDVNAIFGHLKNLLNDQVFRNNRAAQKSAKDLQDLSENGLVTVSESEVEALHLLRQSLVADLAKCGENLCDVQGKVVQLNVETKKVDTAVQNAKEQGDLNRAGIANLRQQLDTKVEKIETDMKEKISKILDAVEDYNRLRNNRDDLTGAVDLIREDVEHLRRGAQNVDIELNKTKSQVASLEIDLASVKCEVQGVANGVATNKNTISGLQKDVLEVKEEVGTLKTKPTQEQNSDDNDALFTAPSRLTAFTGREAALTWLEKHLAPEETSKNCPGSSCCTKAICGLGGCGKTSLAAEFSWRCKNRFPGGVFWINGESDENISKSIVESLVLLNISASTSEKVDDILNRFLAKLSRKKSPWLLVVDNADDLEDQTCPAGVKKICKGPWQRNGNTSKCGHIVFTTRRSSKDTKTFLKLSSDDCFELQCFSEEEGALFLTQRTGIKGESLDPDAILLAKELGSLPLALEQAAAYISALPIPCSFKAYLDKYRAVKLRLLEKQPATALTIEAQHRLSVHTTWQMNFEFVKEKSPAAATMMRIAAFLESENVPIDVINPGFPELAQEELKENARTEIDVDAILKVLSSYSLSSVDQKRRVFAIHKLVQEVVRESLTTEARIGTLKAASQVLHFAFKANNKRDIVNALLLCFRTLKNHMEEESKLLKEDSLHSLYNAEILELCVFVCKLYDGDISLSSVYADLSEFKLRVLRVRVVNNDADQLELLLSTMVHTSFLKQYCRFPQIDKEAKNLSDNAVNKLVELEESSVKVNVDVKFSVLHHSASFYALGKQWEEYYKALLKLEELPVSVGNFITLQQDIATAEHMVQPFNSQSALRRYKNALKISRLARETCSSNGLRIVRLLGTISNLLSEARKVQEAKPYSEELWEICKKKSPTSIPYVFGTVAAMRVKCYSDPQASENILVDILKRNWPHIYEIAASLRQRSVEEIFFGYETEKKEVGILHTVLESFLKVYICKEEKLNLTTSNLTFYRTIAEIKLLIDTSRFGKNHPIMKETYEVLKRINAMLGNEQEVFRLQELVDKCQQVSPQGNKSVHQALPFNDNVIHTRMCKYSANVLFRTKNYLDALELYDQALSLSPDDARLLTNKAVTCVRLSEQSSLEDKQTFLEQALQVSQNAITADPSWVKGHYWRAVCLAHLSKRGPSLAAAAVAKHLFPSQCAKIPAVLDRFGSYDIHVVTTVKEIRDANERKGAQNLVIVVKEGRYELPSPFRIPKNTVIVGLGEVHVCCAKGVPLQLEETAYMENILFENTERKSWKGPY